MTPTASAITRICQLPQGLITRFAPSPTGYLHLGHIASAIFVWGSAQLCQARVILRLEDHDTKRCRPEYYQQIVEDLSWLGFEWHGSVIHQMERQRQLGHFEEYWKKLEVYACGCSRKQIRRALEEQPPPATAVAGYYPGTCRLRPSQTQQPGWRWPVGGGVLGFDDLWLGPCTADPALTLGDPLVKNRDGDYTYNYAVVADDLVDGIDLVVRGHDLFTTTSSQLALGHHLGGQAPRYLHHPLVRSSDGEKLGKRRASTPIKYLREQGAHPEQLLAEAAREVGFVWQGPLTVAQLGEMLAHQGVSQSH